MDEGGGLNFGLSDCAEFCAERLHTRTILGAFLPLRRTASNAFKLLILLNIYTMLFMVGNPPFKGAKLKPLAALLETLAALGRARTLDGGQFAA